ncbi:hypothetical protein H4R18_003557 [Coemansia javaensis]|uniref:Uncharacterized protein n=1 Tax=Coemansia javaensis TaxID=2761396 RepID=A0A9W8HDC9_9FUNG|nr:hypothetical protein H4R18_003557 [Coemansia javaensis]
MSEQLRSRPAGAGLAIDTHPHHQVRHHDASSDLREMYNSSISPQRQQLQQMYQQQIQQPRRPSSSSVQRGIRESLDWAMPGVRPRAAARTSQAELTPVTAQGHITGQQRQYQQQQQQRHYGAAEPASPQSHMARETRRADGAASPQRSAVRQEAFATPPTAHHRASISTVLHNGSQAPGPGARASYATPRARGRHNTTGGAVSPSRHSSQADYDTYDGRSVATGFGFESQFSRPNFDDSSMYAHTPGRDVYQMAMGRNADLDRTTMSAQAGLRTGPAPHEAGLSPESPSLAIFGSARPARRHARVNSVASPSTRARAIEDTRNALTAGTRAGRGQDPDDRHAQRLRDSKTWNVPAAPRDTQSDTFAWGSPANGRARAGSFVVVGAARLPGLDQVPVQRGNGLAVETNRHAHRASYTAGSAHGGSHTPSAIGSSQQPAQQQQQPAQQQRGGRHAGAGRPADAGSSFMSASARRPRRNSQQLKQGRTPIRSNWYHQDEMLSESDLKDQEFVSSDEEDFDDEERGYGGDMVAQQKLIQKQHRTIFDLNQHCKALNRAMNSRTAEPYQALMEEHGRIRARNRRAVRVIDKLQAELEHTQARLRELEDASANPPPCDMGHGVSAGQREQYAAMESELAAARQRLEEEELMAQGRMRQLEEKDSTIRALQEELARERLKAENRRRRDEEPAASPVSPRGRAGTTATASETATVRAVSETSGADDRRTPAERKSSAEAEERRRAAEEELKQARKAIRDKDDQLRSLQREVTRFQDNRRALGDKDDQRELARLANENEALRDEIEAQSRRLEEALTAAAVSQLSLADDGADADAGAGSAAQRAEIAKLRLESRDYEQLAKVHEGRARDLAAELDKTRDQMRRLCRDYLRPRLRELTVGAAQAESVYDHVRRWSQLKVVVPAEEDATPTRAGRRAGPLVPDDGR